MYQRLGRFSRLFLHRVSSREEKEKGERERESQDLNFSRGWERKMKGRRDEAWFYTIVARKDCGKQRPTGVNYWREPLTGEVTRKNVVKMAYVLLFSRAFSALAFVFPRIVAALVSTFSGGIVVLAVLLIAARFLPLSILPL